MRLTLTAIILNLKETNMNVIFTKTALYAYANLEAVADQIDELVEKKALSSMNDYSPAIEQCNKILDFTLQKDVLFALKIHIEEVLEKLNQYELDCLEYKYFKRKPKEYFIGFDFVSRSYFRRQNKLIKKIAMLLEKAGATDVWFKDYCLEMDFFKELLKRVIEREQKSEVNQKNQKKTIKSTFSQEKQLSA